MSAISPIQSSSQFEYAKPKAKVEWIQNLPPKVNTRPIFHLLVLAAAVSAFVGTLLISGGVNLHFSGLNGVVGYSLLALAFGGAVVLGRVLFSPVTPEAMRQSLDFGQDKQIPIGKIRGNDHWHEVVYYSDQVQKKGAVTPEKVERVWGGYLDTSTIDQNGNGIAYIYLPRDLSSHTNNSVALLTLVPVYVAATVAGNMICACLVPFFIAFKLCFKQAQGESRSTFVDIPKEIAYSIGRAIQAPFFGVAYFYSLLYGLIDSINGSKLASFVERQWNGIMRHEGIWLFWPQKNYQSKGVLRPFEGYYTFGCGQPVAAAKFENHTIEKAVTLIANQYPISIYFRKDLITE